MLVIISINTSGYDLHKTPLFFPPFLCKEIDPATFLASEIFKKKRKQAKIDKKNEKAKRKHIF